MARTSIAKRGALLPALAGCLAAAVLPAQEGPLSLELSFSNPGARSMGFGGAFVALADDATAAFANPAGLIQLTRREVSIEGRLWSYSTPFTEGGRLAGVPTGIGLDTVSGLRTAETSEDLSGVSFVSYVYPKKRWAFAFYRHQLARFDSVSETHGFFSEPPEPARSGDFRRSSELDVVTHAFALAYRVSERLSVGLTLAQFDADASFVTETYAPLPVTLEGGLFGRNVYDPRALEETESATSDDSTTGVDLGALWHPTPRWSLGVSYRQGPEISVTATEVSGPASGNGNPAGTVVDSSVDDIRLPAVIGLGAAYRSPGGRLTVACEWDRVEYSTVIDSIGVGAEDARLDDGDELHLGVEVIFPGSTPVVALRAGAWIDPDHRIRFAGGTGALDRAIFRGGDDELHFAFGLGVAVKSIQIDAAVDFSDLVDTASLSAIYSF